MANSRVISILNQKGGVGKTTTSLNLAYTLANKGYDVLAIDWDSQASLTNCLNVGLGEDEEYYGVYEMMISQLRDFEEGEAPELEGLDFAGICEKCICRPTYLKPEMKVDENGKKEVVDVSYEFGFDLLPSHINLSDYELEISNLRDRDRAANGFRLYNVVQKILEWHPYDYVIIDCNPSLGTLSLMAVTAAVNGNICVSNLDLLSTRGLIHLINKIADVQEILLQATDGAVRHMGIIGIVLNLYSARRVVDRTIQYDLNRFYPFKIFSNCIPESVDARKAVLAGVLFSMWNSKAAAAYEALADEIIEKIESMEKEGQQIQRLDFSKSSSVGESYVGEENE